MVKPKKEWIGKTLRELKLRDRFGLNIVAIREGEHTSASLNPDKVLLKDCELYAVADRSTLDQNKLR